jgi:hypothetical protein
LPFFFSRTTATFVSRTWFTGVKPDIAAAREEQERSAASARALGDCFREWCPREMIGPVSIF